jgi:hypothetical protein
MRRLLQRSNRGRLEAVAEVRRAARIDGNHVQIVQALRGAGATVTSLAAHGKGLPDVLVGYRRNNLLVEIKDGSLCPSKRELTPDQVKFHTMWGGQVDVVNNVLEALALLAAVAEAA